jgi:hypothetical protein
MNWKAWVALFVIGAGASEALALPAAALCLPDHGQPMACCCSHDCNAKATRSPGMRSSCCDMRQAPTPGAIPGTLPRQAAPDSPISLNPEPVLPLPLASVVTTAVHGVPASLHAPPLYDLFRSYRI